MKQQVATYKKFKVLTQRWVALSLELCKLEMQEARSEAPNRRPPGSLELSLNELEWRHFPRHRLPRVFTGWGLDSRYFRGKESLKLG